MCSDRGECQKVSFCIILLSNNLNFPENVCLEAFDYCINSPRNKLVMVKENLGVSFTFHKYKRIQKSDSFTSAICRFIGKNLKLKKYTEKYPLQYDGWMIDE